MNFNYEYSAEELNNYNINIIKKIATKYGLKIEQNKSSLINNILQHQDELQFKNNNINIVQIKNGINKLPADAIRLLALNLPYSDVLNLCISLKKFNNEICKNNIFQKQYGLIHLSSDINKLPKDKLGNYIVLKELENISNQAKNNDYYLEKHSHYLGKNNYDKYIINNIKQFNLSNKNLLLKYAAMNNNLNLLEILIGGGVDIETSGLEVLSLAIKYGNLDIVEYLADNGADIHINNDVSLVWAAQDGHLDIVKYLIEKGVNNPEKIDGALMFAAVRGHLNVVKYFIENNLSHVSHRNLLIDAAEGGDLATVKYLVENDADITAEALLMAVRTNRLDVTEYLLNNGAPPGAAGSIPADIHVRNDEALYLAAEKGYLEMVILLIENGADIHAMNDKALQIAAASNHLNVVKYLVENGADIHANNNKALGSAAKFGSLDTVKYLVENGAEIDDKVLKLATKGGYSEVVKYLLE